MAATPESSRIALVAALDGWKAGKTRSNWPINRRPLTLIDDDFLGGRKLLDYKIEGDGQARHRLQLHRHRDARREGRDQEHDTQDSLQRRDRTETRRLARGPKGLSGDALDLIHLEMRPMLRYVPVLLAVCVATPLPVGADDGDKPPPTPLLAPT